MKKNVFSDKYTNNRTSKEDIVNVKKFHGLKIHSVCPFINIVNQSCIKNSVFEIGFTSSCW